MWDNVDVYRWDRLSLRNGWANECVMVVVLVVVITVDASYKVC